MNTIANLNGVQLELHENGFGGCELRLCPLAKVSDRVTQRSGVQSRPECRTSNPGVLKPDSMVQVKIAKDSMDFGFLSGVTMQDSRTTHGLQFIESKRVLATENTYEQIVTVLVNPDSCVHVSHHIEATPVEGTLRLWSSVTNIGDEPIELEHLSSFVLSGVTPFAPDDAAGRVRLHRFRSWWSNEGKYENELLEDLHLVRNWQGNMLINERFGRVGTQPIRKYFPFLALEDSEAGVFWGAQLAWAGSWQMEVTRRADKVSISGGLADYEFGHWMKVLQPGETMVSPKAHVACISGRLDDLTAKLVELQEALLPEPPQVEKSLPVIFNEWCTNWGAPGHDKTIALAKRLQGSGVRYIVIDDGWAKRPPEATMQSNGDWIPDLDKFPHGMKATCDALREMGFIPGVWFEFEVCNPGSRAFEEEDHLLKRRGRVLTVGTRRFWDLNDPWVVDYLDDRMIRFLQENGFGYLKVDYNDNIGIGCDHADSFGEGCREQVEGIYRSFKRLKDKVSELVIENCASGGHRLEPSMMALTDMSSFSDAHESTNIPIIARQLHHLIPPRQSQIWAVLYPDDSVERFMYSLTATFYGRMCLSGPVHDLSDSQMTLVHKAVALYDKVAPIIKSGTSHYLGETPQNWRDPQGWSGICRISRHSGEALVVIHEYENSGLSVGDIELPLDGDWCIESMLTDATTVEPDFYEGSRLSFSSGRPWRGYVLYLKRGPGDI